MAISSIKKNPISLSETSFEKYSWDCISSKSWRMNNLYYIRNKQGKTVQLDLNDEQRQLLACDHGFKIVLKARQLGMTTFFCVYSLDEALFNENIHIGIIAHSLSDAENIFTDKLKFVYEHLPYDLKRKIRVVKDNAKNLIFDNGSTIRVGTSLRSSTLQILHISEFGKICVKYPEKANEIITGAFNTIESDQRIFIESTAEGSAGAFYDMVEQAKKREKLSKTDFKFFFFPWYNNKKYQLENEHNEKFPDKLTQYFEMLETQHNIKLNDQQKFWYFKKEQIQQEFMTREYPSFPEESFANSTEGYFFTEQLNTARDENRIKDVPYDRSEPVFSGWDLGQSKQDTTAIWFFQIIDNFLHFINFMEFRQTPLDLMIPQIEKEQYVMQLCIWPHDAKHTDRSGMSRFVDQANKFGLTGIVLPNSGLLDGINHARTTFSKCFFDRVKCAKGLDYLRRYKKTWDNVYGGYSAKPVHDQNSHAADAFRTVCLGYKQCRVSADPQDTYRIASMYYN